MTQDPRMIASMDRRKHREAALKLIIAAADNLTTLSLQGRHDRESLSSDALTRLRKAIVEIEAYRDLLAE